MTKLFCTFLFLSAVHSLASAWDVSPIAPKPQESPKASQAGSANNNGNPGGGALPDSLGANILLDTRDGQVYPTEEFRGQTWMASNLNFKAPESFCFDNKDENCKKTGRLYTWRSAMRYCPEGWRLPKTSELGIYLTNNFRLGPSNRGGFRNFNGDFYEYNMNVYFWTADLDPSYKDYAYYWTMDTGGLVQKAFYKDQGHSVRCIKGDREENRIYRSKSKASAFDTF